MFLHILTVALMQSQSYRTDSSICHVAQSPVGGVSQVCLSNQVATIEYVDGQVVKSTDPAIIEYLENI
jgi:hypothetical protein